MAPSALDLDDPNVHFTLLFEVDTNPARLNGWFLYIGRDSGEIMRRIAWGITGGGQHLADCLKAMSEVSRGAKVTTFISRAGEEVLRMYGLDGAIEAVSPGDYLEEIILEREQGYSYPKAGRFMLGKYQMLIVAPATSNTVAKIASGIADSLVSNAAALANKAGVPVYLLPTDLSGEAESRMPYFVDRALCGDCVDCPPREACPEGALGDQIDLLLCKGCGTCADLCPKGAIGGGLMKVKARAIDRENISRLRGFPGFHILERPIDILRIR